MVTILMLAAMMVDPPVVSVHHMKVTAYCTCEICCEKWSGGGKTATGSDASICDGVAADPRVMMYGTVLNIPGVGIRKVDDTGGGMRQSTKRMIAHIDVRMKTHEEALAWGVQWLDVGIVKHGKPKKPATKKRSKERRVPVPA